MDGQREYDIVGEILMPAAEVRSMSLGDIEAVWDAAEGFRVTPSAMAVRAQRVGAISVDDTTVYLGQLRREFASRPKPQARAPKTVNGVRDYNGPEFSSRMLRALDAGKLSEREFCRSVYGNRIHPNDLGAFREGLG